MSDSGEADQVADLLAKRLAELEYYTYEQLGRMWHPAPKTIRNWVWQDRRAGIPVAKAGTRRRHRLRTTVVIRGDAAIELGNAHIERRAVG